MTFKFPSKYLVLCMGMLSFVLIFSSIGGAIKDDSLILYFPFEEGKGTITEDKNGNEHTGTLEGGCEWTKEGKFGGAIIFGKNQAQVRVESAPLLNAIDAEMTLSCWIKRSDPPKDPEETTIARCDNWEVGVIQLGSEGPTYNFDVAKFMPYGPNGPVGAYGTTALSDDKWHHVVGTQSEEDGKVIVYVDGEPEGSVDSNGGAGPLEVPWFIGSRGGDGYYFNGVIDEVAIYNRALTENEIKQDMATGVLPTAVSILGKLAITWSRIKAAY